MGKSQIVGIALLSGAGGMPLGAESAGISVKYAIEKNVRAALTYKPNRPQTNALNLDIYEFTTIPRDISKCCTVLIDGALCRGFSSSNRRTNNRSNREKLITYTQVQYHC